MAPSAVRARARARVLVALAAGAALAGAARDAGAHLNFSPLDTSRYVKLEIAPGAVRLVYSIGPGERPALALLRAADTNRDGLVSAAESKALLDGEAARVAGGLRLEVDGVPVRPAFAERTLGLSDPHVAAVPFAIDLVETLRLGAVPPGPSGAPGVHAVLIDDATAFPSAGEIEVRVEEGPGIELLETTVGGRPAPSARSVTFATAARPGEKRDVTVTFRARPGAEGAGAGTGGRWRWLGLNPFALAAAVGFAGIAGGFAWRRERRRPRAGPAAPGNDPH